MGIKKSANTMTKKGGFSSPKFAPRHNKSIATKGTNVTRNTNKPSPYRNTSTTN